MDRRAWLKHYRLSYDVFAKRDVKLCRAMTLMTSLHSMTMRCHEFRKPQLRILLEGMRPRTCMAIDGWCSIRVFCPPCHETLDRRVKALKDVAIVHKSGAVDSSAPALPHCR